VVTSSGARRSISRANASAQRRTTGNSHQRLDPAGDMDAAVAGGLRPARVADLRQRLSHDPAHALRVAEVCARLRVDVDPARRAPSERRDGHGWKSITARFAA
jgi:hypothetical protein